MCEQVKHNLLLAGWVLFASFVLMLQGCGSTPIRISPTRYSFEISESQVPKRIYNVFHEAFSDAKVLRTELYIAGDRLVFFVFRFEAKGKLQEALITPGGKLETSYNVSATE